MFFSFLAWICVLQHASHISTCPCASMPTTAWIYLHDSSREVWPWMKNQSIPGNLRRKAHILSEKIQGPAKCDRKPAQSCTISICVAAMPCCSSVDWGSVRQHVSGRIIWYQLKESSRRSLPTDEWASSLLTLTSALSKGLVHVPCMISNINKSAKQMVLGMCQELGFDTSQKWEFIQE